MILTLCPSVTETAFSLTDPRYNELHTFVAPSKEHKEQFLNEMKQQISNWHVAEAKVRDLLHSIMAQNLIHFDVCRRTLPKERRTWISSEA